MAKRKSGSPIERAQRLTTTTPPPDDLDPEAAAWWQVLRALLAEAGRLGSANPVLVRTAAQLARVTNDAYETTIVEGLTYEIETNTGSIRKFSNPAADHFLSFSKQLRDALKQIGLDELGEKADPLAAVRGRLDEFADGVRRN